jgi:ABC-type multidrug transport system fused ATPase/permease subunit
MSRFDIPEANSMLYVTYLLGSCRANFAYVHPCYIFSGGMQISSYIRFASQVIVGSNGSGKSTILKLAARIYDPTEGSILIDGQDIKTLRLVDLRRAMAILFQDYTHFPLSVSANFYISLPFRRPV